MLIAIFSCQKYLHRRKEIEATWLSKWRGVTTIWVYGGATETHYKGNELHVAAPETYEALPLRSLLTFRFLYKHEDFRYIVKVDDDTFVHPVRLQKFADTADADLYTGWKRVKDFAKIKNDGVPYIQGGAYTVPHRGQKAIANSTIDISKEKIEDGAMSKIMRDEGIYPVHDARFSPSYFQGYPTRLNEMITSHKCEGKMKEILKKCQ